MGVHNLARIGLHRRLLKLAYKVWSGAQRAGPWLAGRQAVRRCPAGLLYWRRCHCREGAVVAGSAVLRAALDPLLSDTNTHAPLSPPGGPQPSMLATFSIGYVLLLRQSAPVQAAVLAIFLRRRGSFERERCAAECAEAALRPDSVVDYAALPQRVARWLGAGGGAAPSCQSACMALHAWLLAVVGVVFPLSILILSEAAARRRFLRQRMPKPRPGPGGGGKGQSWVAMWVPALAWFLATAAGSWAALEWLRRAGLWGT